MPYDPKRDGPLRSGASNEWDEYAEGITPAQAKLIADDIMADDSAPSTTPLPSYGASGVPRGYGKWGDVA